MSAHPPLEEMELNGPGTDTVAVGAHGDNVVLRFQRPVLWLALDPATAMQVGESIARSGYAVEAKQDVYGQRSIIIEQKRQRALLAVEHLLKSEIINKTLSNPKMTANRVVDLVLTELA